jgi:multidrug efflux pump subunit AcrB
MNIARFCIENKVVTYFFTAMLVLGGAWSYTQIGRLEDPEFTIKAAQIVTQYPGASAREVLEEVSDPIEIAAQQMGQLKRVSSVSRPGLSIVTVEMEDSYSGDELPQIWDELRRKIRDMEGSLPAGASKPAVMDDYGDVYGVFYAVYGDGYSYAELREHAKNLRRELLLCEDVAKIDLIGDQAEAIYLEISRETIATLGISPQQIVQAISGQSEAADAGHIRIGDKFIRIDPSGQLAAVEEIGEILIAPPGQSGNHALRLRDIATVRRGYVEPPRNMVKFNGHPAVGLGISTSKGGNVMVMAASIDQRLRDLEGDTPVGIELGVISHQAESVDVAVRGFIVNLLEAVAIVIGVLLVAMGMQSGLLIGAVLLITVMGTVLVMQQIGLLFERISLGAFIIALGMLVDNAIVVTESILIAAQRGEDKFKAAVAVVKQTQWPLLGATAVAVLSFAPIGASNDSTGEYCRSLFLVLLISLSLSWLLAITLTPVLGVRFLGVKNGKTAAGKDPYAGRFYTVYRAFIENCIRHRWTFTLVILALLAAGIFGFGKVQQSFFPDSTRPQFMVHLWMPAGSDIRATAERVDLLAQEARKLEGVTDVIDMTGTGGLRFLLTYSPENADSAYGIIFVGVEDYHLVDELKDRIVSLAETLVPDALVYGQRFVLGPGDPQKIQLRIIGERPEILRDFSERAMAIMRADPRLIEIQTDWRNRSELIRPIIDDSKARRLGVSRSEISQAFKTATLGLPIGSYKEDDDTLPIIMRAPPDEAQDPDALYSAWFHAATLNSSLPLAQLVDDFESGSEENRLGRRNRSLCLTVKCNTSGETAATAFQRIAPQLEAAMAGLPPGYQIEWGGEHESSENANANLAGMIPPIFIMMVMIVVLLFNSLRKPLVIFVTVPLTIIGVTAGLLIFDQPFGFMALLGFLSLVGMQIKNTIVLIDEIGAQQAAGTDPFNAVVNAGVVRLRPVVLAALTTVLGMIPLLADAFYASMAVTIMFGLMFATILTMVVIPVNYAIIYRIPNPEINQK